MPMYTNGVYQDHSVPGLSQRGCGQGCAYPITGTNPGMGGNQYAKHNRAGGSPSSYGRGSGSSHGARTATSHDGLGNRTYK